MNIPHHIQSNDNKILFEYIQMVEKALSTTEPVYATKILDRLLHPEFTLFDQDGRTLTGEQAVISLIANRQNAANITGALKTEALTEQTIHATYTLSLSNSEGNPATINSIWVRSDDIWLLQFYEASDT